MKLGLSTYSLVNVIKSGEMTVLQAIEWIAENGGEHVEIVPFAFSLAENDKLINDIRKKVKEVGIEISNYAVLADLLKETEEEYEKEIARLKAEVDIAAKLGVQLMRHDVSAFRRPMDKNTIIDFEKDLERMVEGCRRIADYADQFDITTMVENHGFYVNGSERVQRLVYEVARANFSTLLDVGNFWCMDEQPLIGVKKNIAYAEMIHLKDFYFRTPQQFPGEGQMYRCDSGTWFQTYTGNLLRGAILGEGDIDMKAVLKVIKDSGFNGYISLEFEGMEEGRQGSKIGLENARRIWESI